MARPGRPPLVRRCTIHCDHETNAGLSSRIADELIFWLVALLFLPLILQDRWRRLCERWSDRDASREQAVDDLVRRVNRKLRDIRREDRLASSLDPIPSVQPARIRVL